MRRIDAPTASAESESHRVLLLAPTGRDADLTRKALERQGTEVLSCDNVADLVLRIQEGAGTCVIALESLEFGALVDLLNVLKAQPAWSDVPLIVLTSSSESDGAAPVLSALKPVSNVTLLERPMRPATLQAAVGAALRTRKRQYEMKRLLYSRERQAAALRGSEQHLRSVLDSLYTFVGVLSPEGTLLEANRAALQWASLEPEDVLGKPFEQTYWWNYDTAVCDRLRQAIEGAKRGETSRYDVPLRLGPDKFIVVDFMLAPMLDESGRITHIIPSASDVTARIEAEQAQRESEARLRRAMLAGDVGTWDLDLRQQTLAASESVEEVFGFAISGAARPFADFMEAIHPADRPRVQATLGRSIESGEPFVAEYRVRRLDGSLRWVTTRGEVLGFEQGRAVRLSGALIDITERKQAEQALEREMLVTETERARLRAVLDALPVGVFIADRNGAIASSNAAGEAIWAKPCLSGGPDAYEEDFKAWWVHSGERVTSDQWALSRALRSGEVSQAEEIEIEAYDGSRKSILNYALPFYDANGRTAGAVAVNVDITERKRQEAERARLAAMVASSLEAMVAVDHEGNVASWNRGAELTYGWTAQEIVGKPLSVTVPVEGRKDFTSTLQRVLSGESITGCEVIRQRKNGEQMIVDLTLTPLRNERNQVTGAFGIVRDVTERRRAETDRARLAAVVQSSYDAIIAKDINGVITDWNRGAERMYGYTAKESIGKPITITFPPDKLDEEMWIRRTIMRGNSVENMDVVRMRKDGELIHVSITVSPIRDGTGRIVGFSSVNRDISERKRLEEQLRRDALHDRLTGLPNRTLFVDRVEHAIARAQRLGENYAVFVLDMDNFKVVNDSLGHLAGDKLLCQFAARVQNCLRPVDTLARFGGDEFTILLEETDGAEAVLQVAERIQQVLGEPFMIEDHEVHSGASIGIAMGSPEYERPDQLIRDADTALYQAKERGKRRHVVFDEHMRERAMSRLRREAQLRRALKNNQLLVLYHPILDLPSGAAVGCEALVRWNHPRDGVLEPDEFMPLAEEAGVSVAIGDFVLDAACRSLDQWRRNYGLSPDFYVSINLSTKQFFHANLRDTVARALRRYRLQGRNLRLEVVETVIMSHDQAARQIMDELRGMGVLLCMDDFGTGYSSLSYLHQFPVDVLKVDRSFIQSIATEERSREIVRSIVAMADNLQLEAIAEGPESAEQLAKVRELGFRLAQGFVFHRPLDSAAMSALLSGVRH